MSNLATSYPPPPLTINFGLNEMRIGISAPIFGKIFGVWLIVPLLVALSGMISSRLNDERLSLITHQHPRIETSGGDSLLAEISRRPGFAFGFRNVLADIVWLEAVQVAGNQKMTHRDYDHLFDLLIVEANFDPKFEIPYLLGGLVLGESPPHAENALRILGRGKNQYPADWRFPFYMGFTHYFSLGDGLAGGGAIAEAARLPGSPPYLPGLASRMLTEAREPEAALELLEPIVKQESDPARRAVLERRVREVIVERDLQVLERAVVKYREKTGVVPESLPALAREGILVRIPTEPNGGNYILDRGGKVRSDRVSERLRVFQKK